MFKLTMQLGTVQKPSLKTSMLLLCSVCGQDMVSEKAHSDQIEARLVGTKNFGTCPCCGQKPLDYNETGYRHRAHRWVTRNLTLIEVANASLRRRQ